MEESKKRDTVGALSSELLKKQSDDTHSAHEQMEEQTKDYWNNMIQCIRENEKKLPSNFYIVVVTKKERLLENVIRNYFFARLSCPSPQYDESVYFYNKKDQAIDFLWTIPDINTCRELLHNAVRLPAEERELLKFVIMFHNGELLQYAKKRNGEKADSILIEG